jgi:CelD/BcsL family acetyltransferase involved in cellulose biosynthesis
MPKVTAIPVSRLSDEQARIWADLQRENPALASPYFSPDFTRAVAAAVQGVEVGIVHEGTKPVAFFPFQRRGKSLGLPVGGILSDFQGLVCRPEFDCDPRRLLAGCGLDAWDFDHLLVSQAAFASSHCSAEASPQMDLSEGFDAYARARKAAGSAQIQKCENMMRRLEREIGPLRFVARETGAGMLERVLDWKSQQYAGTGCDDVFALGWPRLVIQRIHATQTEAFSGMLSLLYAGDELLAGHFGMRSRNVWHYWFPSYDPRAAKYSPGLILLLKIAAHAPSIGIKTIDLGKGMSLYKERLMNTSINVATGSVELASLRSASRALARMTRRCVHQAGLAGIARAMRGWLGEKAPVEIELSETR